MLTTRSDLLEKIPFVETPVARATLADLAEPLWRRFAPPHSTDAPEILLGKLAMAAQDSAQDTQNAQTNIWRPTIAGLLMGSPAPHTFLPGAFIQAVAYRGTRVMPADRPLYQLDAKDITGPLDAQIFAACAFVRKNMRVAAFKHPQGGREDLPQFDMAAVFEAITNAVAHRDYAIAGAKIRLRLFDDRLELYSPGTLPSTMTTDSLPLRQSARNEALTSLLARCPITDDTLALHRQHIMDKRGEGVSLILENSERLSGKRPCYRLIDDTELMLTIPAAHSHAH